MQRVTAPIVRLRRPPPTCVSRALRDLVTAALGVKMENRTATSERSTTSLGKSCCAAPRPYRSAHIATTPFSPKNFTTPRSGKRAVPPAPGGDLQPPRGPSGGVTRRVKRRVDALAPDRVRRRILRGRACRRRPCKRPFTDTRSRYGCPNSATATRSPAAAPRPRRRSARRLRARRRAATDWTAPAAVPRGPPVGVYVGPTGLPDQLASRRSGVECPNAHEVDVLGLQFFARCPNEAGDDDRGEQHQRRADAECSRVPVDGSQ